MVKNVLKTVKSFMLKNKMGLLLCGAGIGVVTTTVLAIKADREVQKEIDHLEREGVELDGKGKAKLYLRRYAPAVMSAVVTTGCLAGAFSTDRIKTKASKLSYDLLRDEYHEYRTRAIETIGEKRDKEIVEEVSKNRLKRSMDEGLMGYPMGSNMLMYDEWSGRFFKGSPESIQRIMNDINAKIIKGNGSYVMVNEYYEEIGLSFNDAGENIGWDLDNMAEANFRANLDENMRPYISVHIEPKYV